jgi:hypothetical protein
MDTVIVAQWPSRLWRVADIEPAPPAHQVISRITRATSVRVVEEVEAWRLFGPLGWAQV